MSNSNGFFPENGMKGEQRIDATGMIVGRLASKIASYLRGKYELDYFPHKNHRKSVVVENADKVQFTGKKETNKIYWRHSGFPGGIYKKTPLDLRQQKAEDILYLAVKRMISKGPLRNKIMKGLKFKKGNNSRC